MKKTIIGLFVLVILLLAYGAALGEDSADFPEFWFRKDFEEQYGTQFVPSDPQIKTYFILLEGEVYDPFKDTFALNRQHAAPMSVLLSPDDIVIIYNSPANSENVADAGKNAFSGMTCTGDPNRALFVLEMDLSYSQSNSLTYTRQNGSTVSIPQYESTLTTTVRNLITGEETSMEFFAYATRANTSVPTSSLEACVGGAIYAPVPSFDSTEFGRSGAFYGIPGPIFFGTWEQDNNTDNGAEAIEWIVLDVHDGKALLISRYGLDARAFEPNGTQYPTWEKSNIRSWLNSDFLNTAFTEEEQAAIETVTISTPPCDDISGGADTRDKIWLLSYEEAKQYFADKLARRTAPTKYAVAQGAYQSKSDMKDGAGCCYWWLRSPGFSDDCASVVATDGLIVRLFTMDDTEVTVRPAFWLDLD